jgi:hypothetical protein
VDQVRKERLARNEANAREVNERFGAHRFVCECGDPSCRDQIELPLEVYRSVRADDRRFIVVPGHETPEMEDVVRSRPTWAVVRKRDEVAHVVER